jgi:hypothetical protein
MQVYRQLSTISAAASSREAFLEATASLLTWAVEESFNFFLCLQLERLPV